MKDTMSLEEYRGLKQSRRKYNNVYTKVDGITFDSIAEANRYGELKFLEKAHLIKDLKVHPRYVLFDKKDGARDLCYEADFSYEDIEKNLPVVVEDVKGHKTRLFIMKWRALKQRYPNYHFVLIET